MSDYEIVCWAVCDSMIAAHYHDDVKDRTVDICNYVKGTYPAYADGWDDIIKGIQFGVKDSPVKPAKYLTYGVCSETAIKYQFNNNAPILARLQLDIGKHAVVLRYYIDGPKPGTEITEDQVGYNDPADGSHMESYKQFVSMWSDSLIFS